MSLQRYWTKLASFVGPKRRPTDAEDIPYIDVGRQTSAAPVYVDLRDRFRIQLSDRDAIELALSLLSVVPALALTPPDVLSLKAKLETVAALDKAKSPRSIGGK